MLPIAIENSTNYLLISKHYSTTRYLSRDKVTLDDFIELQEMVQLDNDKSQGNKIVYRTVLKAYACQLTIICMHSSKILKSFKKG